MRKLVFVVGIGVIGVAVAACSGGGGGGGGTLTSGNYIGSNAAANPDGCGIGGQIDSFNGATFTVTVDSAAHTVNIGGVDYTQSGSNLISADVSTNIDFNPNLDCVLHETETNHGTITGNDKAHIKLTIDASVVSGAACSSLGPTFPCNSVGQFDVTKQ
jgi:hypothetical protein